MYKKKEIFTLKEKDIQERVAQNIKKYRNIEGFTQKQLSKMTGLSLDSINSIECGRVWPSKKSLEKITDALEIDVYRLFLPTENITIRENIPEIREYMLSNIKQIISDAYIEFQKEQNENKNNPERN